MLAREFISHLQISFRTASYRLLLYLCCIHKIFLQGTSHSDWMLDEPWHTMRIVLTFITPFCTIEDHRAPYSRGAKTYKDTLLLDK